MALPRYVRGAVPGQLDISQPSRVLQTPQSTLMFAEHDGRPLPPLAQSQLDSLFASLRSRRIAVDVSQNGITWRYVPSALLNGAPDEGTWPRLVNCWGAEVVQMTREQWDIHKLDDAYTCIVDSVMAHIYPAGSVPASILGVAGAQVPISPPVTDSDARQQPKAGSSAQPYVVEDSDRPSMSPSTPRRSAPHPESDARPHPYAARVETEAESDDESEVADERGPQPPVDPIPAAFSAAFSSTTPSDATAGAQVPPRSAKRKASASPDNADLHRTRSPPIIVLSSDDSGAETETQSHISKDAPGTPRPIYRRAIFDPVGGLSNVNKRRKLDTDHSLPSFRHAFPDVPVYEWAAASGAGSLPKRARPTTSAPLGPSFTRWRSPASSVRAAKPRYKFNLGPRAVPSEEHPLDEPAIQQPEASSSKRRASESPDIQEISDPGPSMKRRRRCTDEAHPPQTPKSAAKRERAERKAAREKIKREARPTASVFASDIDPWADLFSPFGARPYVGAQSTPLFTPASYYYPFAAPPPQQPAPTASSSADQQYGNSPEVEGVFVNGMDSSSSADERTDNDEERAAFIAEAKRKLAELERDRPLWEEAARKRKLQEQREAEEKHRRDQERRRAERFAEEERRNAQRWEYFQKREKMRRAYERQQEEDRAREQARTQERFERYKNAYSSSYWAYGSAGGTGYYPPPPHSHAHTRRSTAAASSTSAWSPALALERYNTQCTAFDSTKFSEEKKLALDAIPWPVLARPPVSVNVVDWDTVGEFYQTLRSTMSKADFAALVDKSHKRWHPDRWRSRTGAFRFIAGTQVQQDEVEKKVNMVSQVLTPLWQETR